MLLAIDIGNTNITIGAYSDGFKTTWRLNTRPLRSTDEYSLLLESFIFHSHLKKPEGAILSSVVPEITDAFTNAVRKSFSINSLIVSSRLNTGLKFNIKNPEDLGADRIANAVAAYNLYNSPVLVIDFGTATTFSAIIDKGEYTGGLIMPGLGISADALCEKTSKLPRIELKRPEKVIGDDTASNILSGLVIGHAGATEKIIREVKKELKEDLRVVATGGFAGLVAPYIEGAIEIKPDLTLEGLRLLYERNA